MQAVVVEDLGGSKRLPIGGTPKYMAPEVRQVNLENKEAEFSSKTDAWSFGVLLLECTSYQLPISYDQLPESMEGKNICCHHDTVRHIIQSLVTKSNERPHLHDFNFIDI